MIKLLLPIFALLLTGAAPASRLDEVAGLLYELPRWHEDRNEEGRLERMRTIARAHLEISERFTCNNGRAPECSRIFAGSSVELMALLETAAFWESRLAKRIHAGDCRKDECDGGKARSIYQIQASPVVPLELWKRVEGLDYPATVAATEGAALALSAAWRTCKHKRGLRGVWATYARGSCSRHYSGSISRARWTRKRLALLN